MCVLKEVELMRNRLLSLAFGFLFLTLPVGALGANMTIYMSAGGSATSPYDTWAKGATTCAQVRALTLDAGTHTINLRPGDSFAGYLDSDNWTAGGTITIQGLDGDGKSIAVDGLPIIGGGEGSTPYGAGTAYGTHIVVGKAVNITIQDVQIQDQDYFENSKVYAIRLNGVVNATIDDSTLDGQLGTTDREAWTYNGAIIVSYATGTVTITDNTIQNWGPPCLWATPAIPAGATAYTSSDSNGIALGGIKAASASVTISGNIISNVNGDCIVEENCFVPITITNNILKNAGENAFDLKGSKNNHVYANYAYRDATFVGMGGNPVATNARNNGLMQFLYLDPDFAENNLVEENYLGPSDTSAFAYKGNVSNNTVRYNYISGVTTGNYFCCSSEASTGSGVGNASYSNMYIGCNGNFVFSYGYRGEMTFENETFYSDEAMGVGLELDYFDGTFRNCVFRMNDSDSEMANIDAYSTPTFSHNIWRNEDAGDDNVVVWAGHTTRTEAAQAGWNGEAIAGNDIFGDPGIGSDGYATGAGSAVINTGATVTYALSGLGSTSVWTYGAVDIDPVSRADNGGPDIGAGELPTAIPPTGGGVAPVGTYLLAWNGDYTDDLSMGWKANGTGDHDGTVAAGVEITGAYGVSVNGARFNAANENIEWTDTAGDTVNPSEGIVWLSLYIESLNAGNTEFYHVYQDGNNEIYAWFESDGGFTLRHEGNGTIVTCATASGVLSALTQYTIGLRWSVANNKVSYKIDAADWVDDEDADAVTAFAAGTRYVTIGETARSSVVGLVNPIRIDNFSLDDTWDTAAPNWATADVTAPTVAAIGVWDGDSCEQNVTDTWGAETVTICMELSEDVIVNESSTAWTMTVGPVAGNTLTGTYLRKATDVATTVLLMDFTLISPMRISHPQMAAATGGTVVDGSANAINWAGSAGDLDGTGTIAINIAYGSTNPLTAGTFTDDESNAYQGAYASLTAAIAAIGNLIAGDNITIGTTTEPGALDLSGDDGTDGTEITITLEGDWTITGAFTPGDYTDIGCAGYAISAGSWPKGGQGVSYTRCKRQ